MDLWVMGTCLGDRSFVQSYSPGGANVTLILSMALWAHLSLPPMRYLQICRSVLRCLQGSPSQDMRGNSLHLALYAVLAMRAKLKVLQYKQSNRSQQTSSQCRIPMNSTTQYTILTDVQLVPQPGELLRNITSCLILAHLPHGMKT